jgi:hypothetical protein
MIGDDHVEIINKSVCASMLRQSANMNPSESSLLKA